MSLGTIIGTFRVVKDPEMIFGTNGTAIANVRLVASRTRKNPDGSYEDLATHWATAKAFGPLAEQLNEQARQGVTVDIWGQVQTDEWEDKTTGEKRSRDVIILNGFRAFPPRGQQQNQGFAQASQQSRDAWSGGQPQGGGYGAPQGGFAQGGGYGAPQQGFDAPF